MAQMRDFFHEAEEAVFGHHHHHREPAPGADPYPQAPAPQPATAAAAPAAAQTQEDTMSLTTISSDLKNDLTGGLDWLADFAGRLRAEAPGLIATTEAVGGSTAGKLAEKVLGFVIPEPYETILLNYAEDFAKRYGQPADPAPTGQQPVQAPAQ